MISVGRAVRSAWRLLPLALSLHASPALAEPSPTPAAREKCPVCGMFVAKYPAWAASAALPGGGRAWFDGAKDLFKFLLDPSRFQPGRKREDLGALTVTDYYALTPVDARAAFFVLGSDTFGPMGHELVPFARREDAEEFLRDHRGTRILRFAEVTPEILRALDEG